MARYVKKRMKQLLAIIVVNIVVLIGIVVCFQQANGFPKCSRLIVHKGRIELNLDAELHNWTLQAIAVNQTDLNDGGSWAPQNCTSQGQLLVVIPYRDRERYLTVLLGHLHPLLQQQRIPYTIYVVEQYGNGTFNKGRIMNAAFKEAMSREYFDCVVFHDVDLIPEDDRIPYSCPDRPMHLSVAVDKLNYTLPYKGLVGGVFLLRTKHFKKINGYSNSFWGWGGEDDDMNSRAYHYGLRIDRPPADIARYKMLLHSKRSGNNNTRILLKESVARMHTDGLGSSQDYRVVSVKKRALFTHVIVDVKPVAVMAD